MRGIFNFQSMFQFSIFKISLIISFVLFPTIAFGAVLSLEPSQGEYNLGDVFLVEIRLDSQGEYLNAAEVYLTFDPEILQVKDFSQGNSILTLWVKEPAFSNKQGSISFTGGIPGGYQGVNGILGKIVFQAKQLGYTEVRFGDNSQLLLNDGLGSQAVLETHGAVFNILAGEPELIKDEWQEGIIQDNIPPESFKIEVSQNQSIFDGKYFITFSTTDKQTGIDYYEIAELKLMDRILKKEKWQKGASPYLLTDQKMRSVVKVRAMDKAGNARIEEIKFPIKWSTILIWALLILLIAGLVYRIFKRYLL